MNKRPAVGSGALAVDDRQEVQNSTVAPAPDNDTDTREIPLTRGYVALVDAEDYDDLAQFNWHALVRPHTVYARRNVWLGDGRKASEQMHRRLCPAVEEVDHINGDGLDNRRANLRPATHAENVRNRSGLEARNTSGLRGVYWCKQKRKWYARIHVAGRKRSLGYFTDPEDAGRAFDAAAIEHFGEFHGYLNFPEPVHSQLPLFDLAGVA